MFVEDGKGEKKLLKNYIGMNVCIDIDMVCRDIMNKKNIVQ